MSLADFTISALKGFAQEVSTWTNQGTLLSINGHIAQIENAAAEDLHAGETAAKAVWADLYSAFHGHEATPAEAPTAPASAPAAPVLLSEPGPEIPAAAFPAGSTVAPTPTPEAAGSAPQESPSPSSSASSTVVSSPPAEPTA